MQSNLRAQVQPFQTYTPQQIQEQLQHLHIQHHDDCESHQQRDERGEKDSSPQKESGSMLHNLLSRPSSNVQSSIATQNLFPLHFARQQLPPPNLSAMLRNVVSKTNHDMPSFPVTMQSLQGTLQQGQGRQSPIPDTRGASVAEGTTQRIDESISGSCHKHPSLANNGLEFSTMPPSKSSLPVSSFKMPDTILTHISNVLSATQLQHYKDTFGFVVEHDGVKLLIATHHNTIQMQLISGDPMKYEKLSALLAAQLQLAQ